MRNSKFILVIFMFLLSIKSQAQNISCKSKYDSLLNTTFFIDSIKFAEYNFGINVFIENNLIINDEEEFIDAINLNRIVEIYIDTLGKVIDVRIKNRPENIWTDFDKKLKIIFKNMNNWQPAECGENKVNSIIEIPIVF